VLVIHGFGVRVRMQSGHLDIEDGVGNERRTIRLARVNHNLRRLVCISDDGFVTLSALKWLSDIGASPVMLDGIGKVVFVTGPTAPSDARLRLAQARALSNGTALAISKELISAKLRGQETLVRDKLKNSAAADAITGFRVRLDNADNLDSVRTLEAHAATHIGMHGATFRYSGQGLIYAEFPTTGARSAPEQVRLRAALGSP
jgi:CRISPR/Cas system-associated endonuclease Cas1